MRNMDPVPDTRLVEREGAGVQVQVSVGEKAPSHVGLDAILDFKPRLLLEIW